MNLKNLTSSALFAVAILFMTGCSAMLPSETHKPMLPWKSFDETASAYERVIEGGATLAELQKMGFALNKVSRAKEWNEITTRNFLLGPNQNTKIEDLPQGAQNCLLAEGGCRAWEFPILETSKQGVGNFLKEKLGWESVRKVLGWGHPAIFFYRIKDEVVVYKLRDPLPLINDTEVKKDPTGPLDWLISKGSWASKFGR